MIDVETEGTFNKAKLSIPFDKNKIPKKDYKNVKMFHYDEEEHTLKELENQKVNEKDGVVSADTTHFSKFVLLYVPNWYDQFEVPVEDGRPKDGYADVAFVIDESNSMETKNDNKPVSDPERYRVKAAKEFTDALIEGDRAAVVGFWDYSNVHQSLSSDFNGVKNAIDNISGNKDSTCVYEGLNSGTNELIQAVNQNEEKRNKFLILLTDGQDSGGWFSNTADEEDYNQIIKTCQDNNIIIYTVGLGTDINIVLLKRLATETKGKYFNILNAEDLPNAFSRIAGDTVKGEDKDDDGIPDVVEENGIRDGMGNVYKLDPKNPDSDGDGLLDGEEVGDVVKDEDKEFYMVFSDPTKPDTDDDGILDIEEGDLGTKIWIADTDNDGLLDGKEYEIGFSPLDSDADKDGYKDKEEYEKNIDPFVYNKQWPDYVTDVMCGLVIGDIVETPKELAGLKIDTESIGYICGQIGGGFIPIAGTIADVRDMIANLVQLDWGDAILSGVGVIPIAGDAANGGKKLTKFITKNLKNSKKVAGAVLWVNKTFPKALPLMAKHSDEMGKAIEKFTKAKDLVLSKKSFINLNSAIKSIEKAGKAIKISKTVDISSNVIKYTSNIWNEKPLKRAAGFYKYLGQNVVGSLSSANKVSASKVTKFKLLDTQTSSFQSKKILERTLLKDIEKLSELDEVKAIEYGEEVLLKSPKKKEYKIFIPNTIATKDQIDIINKVKKTGNSKKIDVVTEVVDQTTDNKDKDEDDEDDEDDDEDDEGETRYHYLSKEKLEKYIDPNKSNILEAKENVLKVEPDTTTSQEIAKKLGGKPTNYTHYIEVKVNKKEVKNDKLEKSINISSPISLKKYNKIKGALIVDFVDVGEGDSIHIQTPENENIVIDTGYLTSGGVNVYQERVKKHLDSMNIKKIDLLVASHYDEDHISSMSKLVKEYEIKEFWSPSFDNITEYKEPETRVYKNLKNALKEKKIPCKYSKDLCGKKYFGGLLEVIQPKNSKEAKKKGEDEVIYTKGGGSSNINNNNSIIILLKLNNKSFLLPGDIEKEVENNITINKDLETKLKGITVLKVAHHGSDTSTSEDFIKLVKPEYAVISDKNGDRSDEVRERLNCKLYTIYKNGKITMITDGSILSDYSQKK
ncbi:MAG: VWA domain-containing protein [Clostridiales bacterium]